MHLVSCFNARTATPDNPRLGEDHVLAHLLAAVIYMHFFKGSRVVSEELGQLHSKAVLWVIVHAKLQAHPSKAPLQATE